MDSEKQQEVYGKKMEGERGPASHTQVHSAPSKIILCRRSFQVRSNVTKEIKCVVSTLWEGQSACRRTVGGVERKGGRSEDL